MPQPDRQIDVAADIGAMFDQLLAGASVIDSGEARVSACLCLTIAELYGAALVVFRSSFQSHAPVLIRSMHEALVDLTNLVKDPSYLGQIRFDNARQTINVVNEFQNDPDLREGADAMSVMGGWREREQATYTDLKAKGYCSIPVLEAFKKAGMAGEYGSYRFMCSFTHSNLNTLIARHATVERVLRFADPLPPQTLKSMLGMAISVYARAVDTVPHYTNISAKHVAEIMDAANATWGPIPTTGPLT